MVRILILLALMASPAAGEPTAASLFGRETAPAGGRPSAIGSYSRGCATGLVALPETGPTWQAMRLSRNRNWGQPQLVAYLEDLSRTARRLGWAGLYIGDMGQPRGGPMTSGHASHQIGLDADVWYLPPRRLDLTRAARESLGAISVRTSDQRRINGNWTPAHRAVLKAAASDPRVDRIFVAAAIKLEICRTAKASDTAWLQKLRPLYGHEDHFHVRLKCPAGMPLCQTQQPTVAKLSQGGTGCDASLDWWVTDYLAPPKTGPKKVAPKGPPKRTARTYVLSDLPRQCAAVLSSR